MSLLSRTFVEGHWPLLKVTDLWIILVLKQCLYNVVFVINRLVNIIRNLPDTEIKRKSRNSDTEIKRKPRNSTLIATLDLGVRLSKVSINKISHETASVDELWYSYSILKISVLWNCYFEFHQVYRTCFCSEQHFYVFLKHTRYNST